MFARLLYDTEKCTTHLQSIKRSEPYSIDKPIFQIQSDTVHALGIATVSTTLPLHSRKGSPMGNFFQKGDQFKRSKKIRVHPSGTGRSSARAHSLD